MRKAAVLVSLGVFLTVSCVKKEQEPQVLNVSFTPCQQTKTKSNELSDKVDIEFTNKGVRITYYDFAVACDFTTVNVTHTFENGVLNITQQGSPNQANCICYTDVSYTIEGISQNEINVILINGVQVYCYNAKEDFCEELSDEELLKLAYDKTYFYPNEFYKDPACPNENIYYVNTVSISPINQRDTSWIELSTNEKNEALMWVNLTISDSSVEYLFISENETDKYFEFKYEESIYSYIVLFRVHKASYYCSIFDRSAPWNHANETEYGYYNATTEDTKVKECIEYLWAQTTFANLGQKVLCSTIKDVNEYFEVHISSLQFIKGDWGMRDCVKVYDNYIKFNKNSKLISFKQSLRKEILGQQR
jgi:hypothetical protein